MRYEATCDTIQLVSRDGCPPASGSTAGHGTRAQGGPREHPINYSQIQLYRYRVIHSYQIHRMIGALYMVYPYKYRYLVRLHVLLHVHCMSNPIAPPSLSPLV